MFHKGPITVVSVGLGSRTSPRGTAVLRLPDDSVVVVNAINFLNFGGNSTGASFTIYNSAGEPGVTRSLGALEPSAVLTKTGFAVVSATIPPASIAQFVETALYADFYDLAGTLLQSTVVVQGPRNQFPADSTALSNGDLVVVWNDTATRDIQLQRLDGSGALVGPRATIGNEGSESFVTPTVAGLTDGGFAAFWVTNTAGDLAVVGQKFDAQGQAVGPQIRIDPSGDGATDPQIAALPGGGFALTWVAEAGGARDVLVQTFGATGQPLSPVLGIGVSAGRQREPEIAADAIGNFAVVYLENDANGRPRPYVQAFAPDGAKLGAPTLVVPYYPANAGYEKVAIASTPTIGRFEISLQTQAPSLQSGYATVVATMDIEQGELGGTILGTRMTDILLGDAGDNLLIGNGSSPSNGTSLSITDIFDGGAGNDTVSFANEMGPVTADLRNSDNPPRLISIEKLIGSSFGDVLLGNDVANRLDGGAGDDLIRTGRGGDVVIGGAGIDTVTYDDSNGTVQVNLTLGRGFNNFADSDTYAGIENVIGSSFDDILIGDAGDNRLDGGAFGFDILIGALGADALFGGPDTDTASYEDSIGTVFVNLLLGRGFNNSAEGDTYNSIENVLGSRFMDVLIGDNGVNRLDGQLGNDTLIGGLGADLLFGGDGIDTASYEDNQGAVFVNLLTGEGFANAAQGDSYFSIENLTGGAFRDYFIGDNGANRLDGSAGDDILLGGLGADMLVGGAGFDVASYEDNQGAVFANLLTGVGASNAAQGDTFAGIEGLVGTVFFDTFLGNDERNVLNGKRGADTLTGNGGNDDFVFDTDIDGQINVDRITDFTPGQDKIVLDNAIFFTLSDGALRPNNLFFGTEATGGQNRIVYDQATGRLWFDDDGNGSDPAILFAVLENRPTLTPDDFFVI